MEKKILNNNLFFEYLIQVINSSDRVELPIKGVSMRPTLREHHDRVVLVRVDFQELFVGAIALFRCDGRYMLHRLVDIDDEWMTFKGDAHDSTERVRKEDIVAIVESIIRGEGQLISCVDTTYRRGVKQYMIYLKFYNLYSRVKSRITRFTNR